MATVAMTPMRLGKRASDGVDGIYRRCFFQDSNEIPAVAASILHALSSSSTADLVFTEQWQSDISRLETFGLSLRSVDGRLWCPDFPVEGLEGLLQELHYDWFFAWLNITQENLMPILLVDELDQLLTDMPSGSIRVQFDIFDDSIYVLSKGISAGELDRRIQAGAERLDWSVTS